MHRTITVCPYDPLWAMAFEKIKQELESAIKDLYIEIHHVGSTSIKGLDAKPIIDIDIEIEQRCFDDIKQTLSMIGYHHVGDQGIKDREAFKYENKKHLMAHHLYVCPQESMELKKHLMFRDYLRSNAYDRDLYSKIKKEGSQKYPHDIDAYIAHKTPFILSIYNKLGLENEVNQTDETSNTTQKLNNTKT
jgi:GrpB-like predicted nucleotidyltransferase (UPF0157 family)